MEIEKIIKVLNDYKNGTLDIEKAIYNLKKLPFEDIEFAKVDNHRKIRNGFSEVIYGEGKTLKQIIGIVEKLSEHNENIMITRTTKDVFDKLNTIYNNCVFYEIARIIVVNKRELIKNEKVVVVITAGTADIPVAEEAAITVEIFGNKVDRIYDVGVAGIHRLFSNLDRILKANVIIVVAGMEGALVSVVAGMVESPVIAVPTSVGYGASFKGLSALLTMLNSCASGVGVVNIDNGFGAGYLASTINRK